MSDRLIITIGTRIVSVLAVGIFLVASPAGAAERSEEDFVKACRSSTNLAEDVCKCSAKKAKGELSGDGFAFLVAMLEDDQATVDSLRGKLPMDQILKASTFMTRGPAQCAKEGAAE